MLFSSSGDSLQSFSDAGIQPATSHQPLSENKSPNVSQSVSSHLSADFKFLKLLEVTASIKYTNSPDYTHTHTHTHTAASLGFRVERLALLQVRRRTGGSSSETSRNVPFKTRSVTAEAMKIKNRTL
ncbi:hypothetical protein AMECASPLE_038587 [Ameca splendens]|uniref:Uncharacterized protein n=1 Tax=Ameca splendens TaxID=208324 RepID=A0ABV0XLF8_9TELE